MPKVIAGLSVLSGRRGNVSDPLGPLGGPGWPLPPSPCSSGARRADICCLAVFTSGPFWRKEFRILVLESSWPPGPKEGSRECFKARLRNSLSGGPEPAIPSLLFHWQVPRPVWFSLEAFLGTQLPQEMPGTGTTQAACAPSSEAKSRSLLFMSPPLAAQMGRGGPVSWEA